MHPHVPVDPKLFNYRLNTDKAAESYEFSCIELNQDHQIYVDYNMGMRVELVDTQVYSADPSQRKPGTAKSGEEMTTKVLEDLKSQLLSQRDKFLLSDKDELP